MEEKNYTFDDIDDILAEVEQKKAAKKQAEQEQLEQEIKDIVEGGKKYIAPELLDNQEDNNTETKEELIEKQPEAKDEIEESIFKDEEKIVLQHETLGTKQDGLEKTKKSKKGIIATAIGAVTLVGIMIVAGKSCSNEKNNNKSSETTVVTPTEITTPVTTTTEETKEFITTTHETMPETLDDESLDTTIPVTDIPHDDEEEIEEQKEISVTTTAINPSELIVTTTAAQTTAKPVQTTVKPVQTTAVTTQQPLVVTDAPANVIKPVTVKNLDKKTDDLIEAIKDAQPFGDRESYENLVRIFNNDFTKHDGYEEIRSLNLDNYLVTILCNIGSNNTSYLNMSYLGVLKDLHNITYLPESLFPESSREMIRKFNKYTEEYVKALNNNQVLETEMDYEFFQEKYLGKYQKYLDDYEIIKEGSETYVGISDFNRYLELLEELVNGKLEEEQEQFELFRLSEELKAQQKRQNAYYKYFEQVSSLMKTKEYAQMGSAKMGLLTSVIPALLSGMDEDAVETILPQYENIASTIVESVDELRYAVVKTNREYNAKKEGKTIDLNEVLETYVKQATEISSNESQMLDDIFEQIRSKNDAKVKKYQ